MIKNITPGTGITINHAHVSWPTFYNSSSGNSLVGQMRYNGSNQNIEVYDGASWLIMNSAYPTIELDGVTQEAIQWTRRQMEEEKRMLELAKKHPTVADALEALAKAQEQVRIVAALVDTA
jgi:hypothetical protein